MRILIAGGTGLLGCSLAHFLRAQGYEVIQAGYSKSERFNCDFTDQKATKKFINSLSPDVIVNLIALTNVDKCELNPNSAYLLNTYTVECLVSAIINSTSSYLIHISTDQLYDSKIPSLESNVIIRNYYGFSKLASELVASQVPSTILRTNFFGKSACFGKLSFSDWVTEKLLTTSETLFFDDIFFNPLSMNSIGKYIDVIIKKQVPGIFNLGSNGGFSKAQFAFEIAKLMELSTEKVLRGSVSQANLIALRPKGMIMNCKKFETIFDIALPSLVDEIHQLR